MKFDSSQAVKGAQACADMVGVMKGFRQFADANNLAGLPDFTKGQYSSSGVLTRGFNDQGQALLNAFDMHAAALTDMAEYFRAAGRTYAHTENQSKDVFDKLADVSIPKSATNLGLTAPKDIDDFTDKVDFDDDVKGPWKDKKTAPLAIHLENKDNQSWSDLYHLGKNIYDSINPYYYAGEAWKYLAGQVDTRVGEFNNKIQALDWTGAGAGGAKEAAAQYANDLKPLVETMKEVAVNLRYASQWMGDTMVDMPDHEKQDTGSCSDDDLDEKRDDFQDDYLKGVQNCASVMAVVPSPTAAPAPDKPTPPDDKKTPPGDKKTPPDDKQTPPDDKQTPPGDRKTPSGGGSPSGSGGGGSASPGGNAKTPNIPPLENKPNPDGSKPNGTKPDGTNPNGTKPDGTNPNGSNPNGSNGNAGQRQGSSGGSSGGSDMSQLTSALSTLMSGASTLAQQLPTILQQLQSLQSTDLSTLANVLGVPEDKLTTAFTAIEKDPAKLAQLNQLLGLSGTPTPTAGLPGDTTPMGGVAPAPAVGVVSAIPAAAVTNSPLAGLTNLFGGLAGVGADHVEPLVGVAAAPAEPVAVTATASATADPVPEQVDFIRALGHTVGTAVEGNPVVEA
ncbi:hypothetical protein [Nocardia concava]|uniref:hypothetical protein n=1 Tax=Nocardia concava TaxID=257281 RepID=UPI0012F83084|nr:hypothetical protein [Nocardia concava]